MAAARHETQHARDAKTVEARVRVEIPRDCEGDLQDGLEAKLGRPTPVERVSDTEIHGLRPRLNDLSVDATVQLRVAVRGTALRTDIETVVGVRDVAIADEPR
ncbi:MAG: hypothetical protein V5A46_09085 [Haloferacaceae archaeon]